MLVVVSTGLAAGCGHRPEERRAPPREYRAEYRGEWNKLGERSVDGTHDRDVIWVGAREGAYRRIMIVVENSALEMHSVVVHFSDGSAFAPETRHVFAANTRSHVIDLPGWRRNIQQRRVPLRQPPRGGRAEAELWAQ